MTKVFDDVISQATLDEMYDDLISSQMWAIDRKSSKENKHYHNFPGHVVLEKDGAVNNRSLFGYFAGLVEQLRHRHMEKYGELLPPKIKRIHLGAKTITSHTNIHIDTDEKGVVIVGFTTPTWKEEWGGDLKIENQDEVELIKYKPGRFCIFNTDRPHDGLAPKGDCHLWRISVNIILTYE